MSVGQIAKAFSFVLFLLAASFAQAADTSKPPTGAVILTFGGDIGKTNRGPFHEKLDGFMAYHEITFKKAFAFDLEMLGTFPQKEIVSQPPQYDKAVTFRGAVFNDVLKAIGADKASLATRALDGFSVELTPEKIAAKDWILATHADGRPFGLGDKGPVWLMHTPSKQKVPEEEEQGWPWALFYIEVKK